MSVPADYFPQVYDELRKLAAAKLSHEPTGHTLDATALVHEAFLRLQTDQSWENSGHFFAAAAEAMRRILVDHARTKGRQKRGGTRKRVDLGDPASVLNDPDNLLDLDDALQRLKREDPRCAELVSLRLFAGLTVDSPFGKFTYRAEDHQSTMGAFVGKTKNDNGKGAMVDYKYLDGAKYLPSNEQVKKLRPAE